MKVSGPKGYSPSNWKGTAAAVFLIILISLLSLGTASAQDQDEKAPVIVPNTPYYEPDERAEQAVLPVSAPGHLPANRPAAVASRSSLVIPSGSNLAIQFDDELEFGERGTFFQAVLAEDLVQNQRVVAAKGTPVRGEVYRDPSNDKLHIEITDLQLGPDWQPVYTRPLKAEAKKKGRGFWSKFATGLGIAGIVAGEALDAGSRGRRGCPTRRNRSAGRAALAAGAQAGGALLLSRQVYGNVRGPSYKIKKGKQYSFTLEDDLRIP
ncbi:MAG TPA: hypothetical protein VLV83_14870 [Acidobacteriota bacterium]|nr:hypothetical protein [Acidobacteriota bacterium]